jgi:hypothetical protein
VGNGPTRAWTCCTYQLFAQKREGNVAAVVQHGNRPWGHTACDRRTVWRDGGKHLPERGYLRHQENGHAPKLLGSCVGVMTTPTVPTTLAVSAVGVVIHALSMATIRRLSQIPLADGR